MRDNLLFFGIPESTRTPDDMWSAQPEQNDDNNVATGVPQPAHTQQSQNGENCEAKVHVFLSEVLKVLVKKCMSTEPIELVCYGQIKCVQ